MNSRPCTGFILFAVMAFGLNADSASQIENLASWSVHGVTKETLAAATGLELPANVQLFRSTPTADVRLNLVSSPVFASTPEDLPVVEIGSAAVTFLREGANGRLVLVLGDNPPLTLPWIINLDDSGRSAGSLTLALAREGASVAITTQGQTLQFPAGPDACRREIVLSAGANAPWSIQGLATESNVDSGAAPKPADRASALPTPTAPAGGLLAGASAPGDFSASGESAAVSTETKPTEIQKSPARPRLNSLEIFTPSSVRHGRAERVRAVISQAQAGEGRAQP